MTILEKGAFGRLPVVFELNLSGNQIKNVSHRAFDGLLQLLKLDLSYNNLTHIPNGAFLGEYLNFLEFQKILYFWARG